MDFDALMKLKFNLSCVFMLIKNSSYKIRHMTYSVTQPED